VPLRSFSVVVVVVSGREKWEEEEEGGWRKLQFCWLVPSLYIVCLPKRHPVPPPPPITTTTEI
jgi:hypothetical protein